MPRKIARRRTYDVPFVGIGIKPFKLDRRQSDAIATILRHQPSREFTNAYGFMLGTYVAHRKSVSSSTPAAVQNRIATVVHQAKKFQDSLKKLELTDKVLIGRFEIERFLRKERSGGVGELYEKISRFLPAVEDALDIINKEQKRGRMPAFAEQVLARGLRQILFEETAIIPTAKKSGPLHRLLLLAFEQAGESNQRVSPRNDVADLIRPILRDPLDDMSVLSGF